MDSFLFQVKCGNLIHKLKEMEHMLTFFESVSKFKNFDFSYIFPQDFFKGKILTKKISMKV